MIDVAVIGGGASGLMSAISAKRTDKSKRVVVFEGNNRVAKKLITTGNGRCNITNKHIDITRFHSQNIDLVEKALSQFSLGDTLDFFKSLNIPIIDDGNEKLYPASFQAQSVVDALRFECEKIGVEIITDCKVEKLISSKDGFVINDNYRAEKVIVACGGKSAPKTGSDGSGYSLLEALGHSCGKLFPSITPLKTDVSCIKSAKGMKADVELTLTDGKKKVKSSGELLFTDYGISGPVVLQISRFAAVNKNCVALIDFLPYMSFDEVKGEVINRAKTAYKDTNENLLLGLINKRIGFSVIKKSDISLIGNCSELTDRQLSKIAENLKAFSLEVRGVCGFDASQATAGGVSLNEFDDNLQSKLVKNLYACGEVLDVDGDCGGFNLQWAWTSGYIAGKNASI